MTKKEFDKNIKVGDIVSIIGIDKPIDCVVTTKTEKAVNTVSVEKGESGLPLYSFYRTYDEIICKRNEISDYDKAKSIAREVVKKKSFYSPTPDFFSAKDGAWEMAKYKNEQFAGKIKIIKDEIQNYLCAVSGQADEYAHGYEDCGMKIIELINTYANETNNKKIV